MSEGQYDRGLTRITQICVHPRSSAAAGLSYFLDRRIYIVDTGLTSWHFCDIDAKEGIEQMRVTVKKWGNSAAVRLPASVMQATQLELDDEVDVREDQGRIVIKPVKLRRYELSELLKGITNKNQHREIDFGPAVGGEIW